MLFKYLEVPYIVFTKIYSKNKGTVKSNSQQSISTTLQHHKVIITPRCKEILHVLKKQTGLHIFQSSSPFSFTILYLGIILIITNPNHMLTFDTHATRYSNVTYRYNIHAIVYDLNKEFPLVW